jgi:hypothetical protein
VVDSSVSQGHEMPDDGRDGDAALDSADGQVKSD